ncbi:MAG: tripartite tricarboxylate transporter substrate binding protein [Pseudomonadota bacterium]
MNILCRLLCVSLLVSSHATLLAAPPAGPATPTIERLHLLIPGAAGGGWDRTARGIGEAFSRSGLVDSISYENLSGGGGAKGIAHLIETADPDMLMVNSTPIVVRALQKVFPQSFRDLTPVASVIGDFSVLAVRTRSPYQNLRAFLQDQQRQPRKLAIGGGSVSGGTDHIFAAQLIQAGGGDPQQVKYIPYDAGGKAMAGLLSGEVKVLSSGYGEVVDLAQQGWVRILCIAAAQRISQAPQVPTCNEAGAPGAEFVNWRGFFAAPGTSDARLRDLQHLFATMYATPAWQEVRERYGWVDLYRPGAEFTQLLETQENMLATLLADLGLLQ